MESPLHTVGTFTPHPLSDFPSSPASFPCTLFTPSCFLGFSFKHTICTHVLPSGSAFRRTQIKNISRESGAYKLMGEFYGDLASFFKGCHVALQSFLRNAHGSLLIHWVWLLNWMANLAAIALSSKAHGKREGTESSLLVLCGSLQSLFGGKIRTEPQFCLPHFTLSRAELLQTSLHPGRSNCLLKRVLFHFSKRRVVGGKSCRLHGKYTQGAEGVSPILSPPRESWGEVTQDKKQEKTVSEY